MGSCDTRRASGLALTGALAGALGGVVFVGCALRTRAAAREPAVAAPILPSVVRAGQTVDRGQVIGFVGTSGNAPEDTPHLHFAMFRLESKGRWWGGVPVNPYPMLRGDPLAADGLAAE